MNISAFLQLLVCQLVLMYLFVVQGWEETPKLGNQCMILFPGLSGSQGTKSYVMAFEPTPDDYDKSDSVKVRDDAAIGKVGMRRLEEMGVVDITGKHKGKEAAKGKEDVGSEYNKKGENDKPIKRNEIKLKAEVKEEEAEIADPKKGNGNVVIEESKQDDQVGKPGGGGGEMGKGRGGEVKRCRR